VTAHTAVVLSVTECETVRQMRGKNVFSGTKSGYWHPELMFYSDLTWYTLKGMQMVGIMDIVLSNIQT
jgi:hypothetical protein